MVLFPVKSGSLVPTQLVVEDAKGGWGALTAIGGRSPVLDAEFSTPADLRETRQRTNPLPEGAMRAVPPMPPALGDGNAKPTRT
jgi:hypothetical protein